MSFVISKLFHTFANRMRKSKGLGQRTKGLGQKTKKPQTFDIRPLIGRLAE